MAAPLVKNLPKVLGQIRAANVAGVIRLYSTPTDPKGGKPTSSTTKPSTAPKPAPKPSQSAGPVADGTRYECGMYYEHNPLTYTDYEGILREHRLQQPSAK